MSLSAKRMFTDITRSALCPPPPPAGEEPQASPDEQERANLSQFWKMSPLVVPIAMFGVLAGGTYWSLSGHSFHWWAAAIGGGIALAVCGWAGSMMSPSAAVVNAVAAGVAFGVACGIVKTRVLIALLPPTPTILGSAILGVTFGITLGTQMAIQVRSFRHLVLIGVVGGAIAAPIMNVGTFLIGGVSYGCRAALAGYLPFLVLFLATSLRLVSYPLMFIWCCVLWLACLSSRFHQEDAWRSWPIFWEDGGRLPHPFFRRFLVRFVHRHPQRGARLVAFLVRHRQGQRGTLRAALAELGVRTVQVQSLDALVRSSRRLTYLLKIPLALSPGLAYVLWRFKEIAEHAQISIQSPEQQQRIDRLRQVFPKLERLRRAVRQARGRSVGPITDAIDNWSAILTAAMRP